MDKLLPTLIILYIFCIQNTKPQYGTYLYSLVGKPTDQSSVYTENRGGGRTVSGASDKAVDGNNNTVFTNGYCSHTENDDQPWWAVDMGNSVTVFSVTITNRESQSWRLNMFSVHGSNEKLNPLMDHRKHRCFTFNDHFGDGETRTFECNPHMHARYLSVTLPEKRHLTLCEVQVTAVCQDGTYGEECAQSCSPNCKNQPCDKFTADGVCPGLECKTGYKGGNCSIPCPFATYGDGCIHSCSINCKNKCSQQTGTCNNGCNPGYTGRTCETECHMGFFGQDCENQCHCKQGTCNHVTGLGCDECVDSYTGQTCTDKQTTTTTGKSTSKTTIMSSSTTIPRTTSTMKATNTETVELSTESKSTSIPGGDSQTQTQGGNRPDNTRSGFNVPVIAGSVIGVIVVIVLILAVIFVTRGRRVKTPSEENIVHEAKEPEIQVIPQVTVRPFVQEESEASTSSHEVLDEAKDTSDMAVEIEENTYVNVTRDGSKSKLKLRDVGAFIENQKTQKHPFFDEYEDIPKKTASWSEAGVSELKSKNRYINILPYNYNRVKLQPIDDNPHSSYINASYIKDFSGMESYIAALGSTDKTLNDTWRMIWQADISNIVMVTNLVEESKTKCIQYWPLGKSAQYGEISVTLEQEEHHTHYVKRTLKASHDSNSRSVTHFHYTAWPDKQAPGNLSSVLHLREIVKDLRVHKNIPILIHCSAGIGRTGTLIALDILLDQAAKEEAIDVYKCVTKLREQRTLMVQTLEQYVFLYHSLHELYEIGKTFVQEKDIESFVKSETFQTEVAKQYNFLENIKPEIPAEELILGKVDHAETNRDEYIIAGDEQRVILMSNPDRYVNAVYVSDYNKTRAYCATQLPLKDTVGDFWKMVFEVKSVAVVCLETDPGDTWKFIPGTDRPILYENMQIGLRETKEESDLTIHHIEISTVMEYANVPFKPESDDFHQLELYELKSWTTRPITRREVTPLRSVLEHVQMYRSTEERKPLLVMCKNGATETGVYIALSILVDNMKAEHEVDVFQVVKMIRKNRPDFIVTQEQFMWLYESIAEIAKEHKVQVMENVL